RKLVNPVPYPLVYVLWDDACTNPGWHTHEEFEEWKEVAEFICHEVGWLLEETDEHYIFAHRYIPPYIGELSKWGVLQRIPKAWAKIYVLLPASKDAH
ncbi:MAG: hypothetical protein ACE5D4_08815, partial [Thermodesulfobacteriota bacterium]